MTIARIESPDAPALKELQAKLSESAAQTDRTNEWPQRQLDLCAEAGVFEWFLGTHWGGQGWGDADVVRGYLALSAACLNTTFILTQRTGACRRIATSGNQKMAEELLPALVRGDSFATVGISHLTTSRRHLKKPVLRAERVEGGFVLDGFSPWVTGAAFAQTVVVGATLIEGEESTADQLLLALPMETKGVSTPDHAQLVGLTASHTGPVQLDQVFVAEERLLAGPAPQVMQAGNATGANTGGHETSTLAIGLAAAAIEFVNQEAAKRPDLQSPAEALQREHTALQADLLAIAQGETPCSSQDLRARANSLVLRATQASLTAAKGSGYVVGHPAGRWCREALFFLVWSCPQPVAEAGLCELAGIQE